MGYHNSVHFFRQFRQHHGTTPQVWRKTQLSISVISIYCLVVWRSARLRRTVAYDSCVSPEYRRKYSRYICNPNFAIAYAITLFSSLE
nr:hypothetical protein [Nostoc sp. MG11]